jgi:hypothetical protein
MRIKNFIDFINEMKVFIYKRKFRLESLISNNIYNTELINGWMSTYDVDKYAHCVFITKKPIVGNIEDINVKFSEFDIPNKVFFDTDVKKYLGYLPDDSKLVIGGNDVYLYIFKKNSNIKYRARQIHGFIYEGQLKRFNGLEKLGRTNKWDAKGGLDKRYLDIRLDESKKIDFFNGSKYKSLIKTDDVSGFKTIDWDILGDDFKQQYYWNIKCMSNNTDIELGDFKRISGIKTSGDELSLLYDSSKSFIFAVSFHDGSVDKKIVEEYIVLMSIDRWKELLPNISENISDFKNMYIELRDHRYKGDRDIQKDIEWKKYVLKYKKLTDLSKIKLRFKRDTKGQLRIQSSISYTNFKSFVLKLPHIKIV